MDPNCPWNIKPILPLGDSSADDVFLAVGRALTQWEVLEGRLGYMFGLIVDSRRTDAASRAYGAVSSFQARYDMLAAAFAASPARHDPAVAPFDALLKRIAHFGPRRNDIAHGMVTKFNVDRKERGHYLCPAQYATKRRRRPGTALGDYAYTSAQIYEYVAEFIACGKAILPFMTAVQEYWARAGS